MSENGPPRSGGLAPGRVVSLTLAALFSFALNSLLCRAALGARLIDAVSFTGIRLTAAAPLPGLLVALQRRRSSPAPRTPFGSRALAAAALFLYALPFSLAYLRIQTGTGAFLLFGCVQITMIGYDVAHGRRLSAREAIGLGISVIGL